ncbi:MAG: uroporphyrinogen decarboxylase [Calditerrivibrio sp.]|nr:uroporphyrinogen decarboxylase [Calditerrivibrio sp.]
MNTLLLDVLEGKKVKRPPVWLMRQAGRYMPEYMEVRRKVTFLELCKTPELAAEVTHQPIDILGVDAAILFSDILIPIEPMGVNLDFNPAPIISNPVRSEQDANRLRLLDPYSDVPFVIETVKLLVKSLKVPLIGFSGAPFTLACYMVEGGGSKNFIEIKKMMHTNTKAYETLMEKLTISTTKYLQAQIDNGCPVVQIFDTWAGILSPMEYQTKVLPYVKSLIENLKNAHIIYFAKDSATFYKYISDLNCTGIGVDWKIDLDDADISLGRGRFVLQGNLDPVILFSDKDTISRHVKAIIEKGKTLKGHIFNLGHGILPNSPVENVKFLVDLVKNSV